MFASIASTASAQNQPKIEIVPHVAHFEDVHSVALSADDARVLSGSADKTVKLWNAATGALLRTFEGHSDKVYSVAFSADDARVLSGSADKTVKLWDAATGAPLRTFEGHSGEVFSVAFSADGARVLSGSADRSVNLWDAATGALLRTFEGHSDKVYSVAFSADGVRVLSGSWDGTVKLWDAATGALLRTLEGRYRVSSVTFSADGARVLSGSWDGTVRLWDAATGALLRTFKTPSLYIRSVALSADGARVLSGSHDHTVNLWDTTTGALLRTFRGHSRAVNSVALSSNGALVLSGSEDGTAKLWDAATAAHIRTFEGHSREIRSVAVSADGARMLSGSWDGRVKLWDSATGALIRSFDGHSSWVSSVALSADGRRVLSGGGGALRLWDAATGDLLGTFEVPFGFKGHLGGVSSVALPADGGRVLSGSYDGTLRLWNAATGELIRIFKRPTSGLRSVAHSRQVTSIAFSPDGSRVLSGSFDGTMRLWNAATGELIRIFRGHSSGVSSVAFSADGARVLSGGGALKLWDAATGALLRTFNVPLGFEGHLGGIKSVALSADGGRVLSGGGSTLMLWNAATGAPIRTFEGHSGRVLSVAPSTDGRRVISGGSDSTIRIWDAATGAQLALLIGGRDGRWLTTTPKGFFAASSEGTELLSVVRGLKSYSVTQFYRYLYRPDLVEEALKGDPERKHKDAAHRLNLETILDKGPEPEIKHLEKKTKRDGDRVTLAVSIVDRGGGIGSRVVWRVNGGHAQGRAEPEELKGAQAPSFSAFPLTETLRVDPGKDNIVELTAYNGAGEIATPPFRITVHKSGIVTAEKLPRMHVLAIGVNKYRMAAYELKYAVNDAVKFAKALEVVGSTLFAKAPPTILKDEEVTESAIAAAFDRIGADAKRTDVFVLYLAGHGTSIEGKYYYYPQTLDFKANQNVEDHGIGQDKWEEWLRKVGHVGKAVLILDTCYASAAGDLIRGNTIQTALDHFKSATGQNLIAASRDAAREGYKGHGVLTRAVLEALHKTDGSADDSVQVGGLADYVSRRVPQITREEFGRPQYPFRKLSEIDFPIGIRAKVLVDDECSIPGIHPHFLIRDQRIRDRPLDDAQGGDVLKFGLDVCVGKIEAGWAAIYRDGKRLGYVPKEAVLPRPSLPKK